MQVFLLYCTFLCAAATGQEEVQRIGTIVTNYFDGPTYRKFFGQWQKYRAPIENAIESALKETYSARGMNVYVRKLKDPHKLSEGVLVYDNVVHVLFKDLYLTQLPRLSNPEVSFALASNVLRVEAALTRMFIQADYQVFRNISDLVYGSEAFDPMKTSPFNLQHVRNNGEVTIVAENCILTGLVVTTLNDKSVNLGHDSIEVANCVFYVEISTPGLGSPPVIAPYFSIEHGKVLEMLLSRPVRDELLPKLQGAVFTIVNTSSIFGDLLSEIRQNQRSLFKSTSSYMTRTTGIINQMTLEEDGGISTKWIEDVNIKWTDKNAEGNIQDYKLVLQNLTVTGFDSAYSAQKGGPYKVPAVRLSETIRFSDLQVRGSLFYSASAAGEQDVNSNKYDFFCEIYDVSSSVSISLDDQSKTRRTKDKEESKFIYQVQMFGWRNMELHVPIDLPTISPHSLISGIILNELPKIVVKRLEWSFIDAVDYSGEKMLGKQPFKLENGDKSEGSGESKDIEDPNMEANVHENEPNAHDNEPKNVANNEFSDTDKDVQEISKVYLNQKTQGSPMFDAKIMDEPMFGENLNGNFFFDHKLEPHTTKIKKPAKTKFNAKTIGNAYLNQKTQGSPMFDEKMMDEPMFGENLNGNLFFDHKLEPHTTKIKKPAKTKFNAKTMGNAYLNQKTQGSPMFDEKMMDEPMFGENLNGNLFFDHKLEPHTTKIKKPAKTKFNAKTIGNAYLNQKTQGSPMFDEKMMDEPMFGENLNGNLSFDHKLGPHIINIKKPAKPKFNAKTIGNVYLNQKTQGSPIFDEKMMDEPMFGENLNGNLSFDHKLGPHIIKIKKPAKPKFNAKTIGNVYLNQKTQGSPMFDEKMMDEPMFGENLNGSLSFDQKLGPHIIKIKKPAKPKFNAKTKDKPISGSGMQEPLYHKHPDKEFFGSSRPKVPESMFEEKMLDKPMFRDVEQENIGMFERNIFGNPMFGKNGTVHRYKGVRYFNFSNINPSEGPYDIEFRLFTRDKPGYILLKENAEPVDPNKKVDLSKDLLKVVTHGWKSSTDQRSVTLIKIAYLHTSRLNIVAVDWRKLANVAYSTAVLNVRIVAEIVSRFLEAVENRYGVGGDRMHLLGHSLGAHLVGIAASKTRFRIQRVTGLDPAGPVYEYPFLFPPNERIDSSCADLVDIYHTCGGLLGFIRPLGHLDFYPNGGLFLQPDCIKSCKPVSCSHSKAYEYYSNTILNNEIYRAYRCDNWVDFLIRPFGNCDDHYIYIGDGVRANNFTQGKYYSVIINDPNPQWRRKQTFCKP